MPRDVATRWNSTYNMLEFAINYRLAIDKITGDKSANLHKYELDNDEWMIAMQLHNILKGCNPWIFLSHSYRSLGARYSKMPHYFFPIQPPVLQLSFLLWTILTRPLPITPLILTLNPQFAPLMESPKKTLNKYYNATDQLEVYRIAMGTCFPTGTYHFHLSYYYFFSLTSSPQTQILQACQLGERLGPDSQGNSPSKI